MSAGYNVSYTGSIYTGNIGGSGVTYNTPPPILTLKGGQTVIEGDVKIEGSTHLEKVFMEQNLDKVSRIILLDNTDNSLCYIDYNNFINEIKKEISVSKTKPLMVMYIPTSYTSYQKDDILKSIQNDKILNEQYNILLAEDSNAETIWVDPVSSGVTDIDFADLKKELKNKKILN